MPARHREPARIALDRCLPKLRTRFRIEADHFTLPARDERFPREDQRGLVRRFHLPLHTHQDNFLERLLLGGELIFLRLIVQTLRLVTLPRVGERHLRFCEHGLRSGVLRGSFFFRRLDLREILPGGSQFLFRRRHFLQLIQRGMFFQESAQRRQRNLSLVTLARALRVADAIHGGDFFAVGKVAHVARERHLLPHEPTEARLPARLFRREDLVFADGVDLIVRQQRLRAADAAPRAGGAVELLAGGAVECHGQRAARGHEENVLRREQIALR